jgi:hypothetical protein
VRLTDHVTLNFNNISTAAVFLDTEKTFDTSLHLGLLYKLSKIEFPCNLINHISSSLSERKFGVSVEGEMLTPRDTEAGVPQSSVLSPTLYNVYINDIPQTPGANFALFADDTCLYATEHKEGYVLRKFQRLLNSLTAWCKQWNIKIIEEKTQAIYFSRQIIPPDTLPTLNRHNISFVNSIKYIGAIFDKKFTWRLHIEMVTI